MRFNLRIINSAGLLVPFDRSKLEYTRRLIETSNGYLTAHAGGPSYKGVAAAVTADAAIDCAGTDGAPVAAAGDDDDDDGDGDGDPDSDRAPHTPPKLLSTKTLHKTLDRKRVTDSTRIIRMAELKTRIGLSRSTIYELIKVGNFPSSISLGSRAVGWLSSDLDSWLESRIQSSNS